MSTPTIELLYPSIADVRHAEEQEREWRKLAENSFIAVNAYKLADVFKTSNKKTVLSHNKGANRYFWRLEERERSRRLADVSALELAKKNALACSKLVSGTPYSRVVPSRKGSFRYTAKLEEAERLRRLNEPSEAAMRKMRALRLSEGIRVNAPTLRARLIKRKPVSLMEKGKEALASASNMLPSKEQVAQTASLVADKTLETANIVADKTLEALPSKEQVMHTAEVVGQTAGAVGHAAYESLPSKQQVMHTAEVVGHVVADTASSAATTASNWFSNALNKVSSVADSVVHSVQHAITGDEELHDSNLKSVRALEEVERQRRMTTDRTGNARGNARKVSLLMSGARFPTLSGTSGSNKWLSSIAERERTRRLANKFESEEREANARKVSGLLTSLGWPFIRDAKFGNQKFSQLHSLEEQERSRRMQDNFGNFTTRYNAGKVSQLIKDSFFTEDKSFSFKYINKLEEKERAWRLANTNSLTQNARREAALISNLGWPAFRSASQPQGRTRSLSSCDRTAALQQTKLAEEGERQYRLNMQKMREDQTLLAKREKAAKLARMLAKGNTANNTALPVSVSQRLSNANDNRAKDFSSFVFQDTNLLEEKERRSRLNDKLTQHMYKSNAHKVSGMIKAHNKKLALAGKPTSLRNSAVVIDIAPSPATLRPAQAAVPLAPMAAAQPAARSIPLPPLTANPISRPSRPAPGLASGVPTAFSAAPATTSLPTPAPLVAPLAAPLISKPATIATTTLPSAPLTAPLAAPLARPTVAPAPLAAAPLAKPVSTFSSAPLASAPLTSAPLASAPLRSAPLTSAPLTSAPLTSAPLASAPLRSAPITSAPLTSAPLARPTSTFASAPLASAPLARPSTTYSTTPIVNPTYAATSSAPLPADTKLYDQARKMYEQELVKAQTLSQKAVALRTKKGRFSSLKANLHEHSAQKHLANAQRHQEWLQTQNQPISYTSAPAVSSHGLAAM